jgi:hypothetical protein
LICPGPDNGVLSEKKVIERSFALSWNSFLLNYNRVVRVKGKSVFLKFTF